eukprot:7947745-Ditylum_brightwellii.AAC.1
MADPAEHANGMQLNKEYEDQFVWDDNSQESIKNLAVDSAMETADDSRGKRKLAETATTTSKVSKTKVKLNTQDENAQTKLVKEKIHQ